MQNYLKLISKSVGTSVYVQTGGEISELIYFSISVFQLQVCLHWCVFAFLCHCVRVFFCLCVCMQVGGGEISEEVCKCTNANNANNGGSTSDLDHHFQAGVWGRKIGLHMDTMIMPKDILKYWK